MNIYVTLEYKHAYATVNSMWAAAKQHSFVPDRIVVLTPDPDSAHAKRIATMLNAVQEAFGKSPSVTLEHIDQDDLAGTRAAVRKMVKARKMEGHTIAVDVTPGRTLAKLAVFQACVDEKPHHVFYLDVSDYDYRDAPYVVIPRRLQTSRDVLKEVTRDG